MLFPPLSFLLSNTASSPRLIRLYPGDKLRLNNTDKCRDNKECAQHIEKQQDGKQYAHFRLEFKGRENPHYKSYGKGGCYHDNCPPV